MENIQSSSPGILWSRIWSPSKKPRFNPGATSLAQGLPYVGLTEQDVNAAHDRLARFAPYLAKAFPQTAAAGGMIESDVVAIPAMQKRLEKEYGQTIDGEMLLKKTVTGNLWFH